MRDKIQKSVHNQILRVVDLPFDGWQVYQKMDDRGVFLLWRTVVWAVGRGLK